MINKYFTRSKYRLVLFVVIHIYKQMGIKNCMLVPILTGKLLDFDFENNCLGKPPVNSFSYIGRKNSTLAILKSIKTWLPFICAILNFQCSREASKSCASYN